MNSAQFFKRIRDAVEKGQQAFWQVIAESFPEATSGDFDPEATLALEMSLLLAVLRWTRDNILLSRTGNETFACAAPTRSLTRELSQEEWEKEAFHAWLVNDHTRLAELMALEEDIHGR